MEVLKIAAFLGARIIEKHFTFDKNLPGNDHYHSMDKVDLKIFWQIFREFKPCWAKRINILWNLKVLLDRMLVEVWLLPLI